MAVQNLTILQWNSHSINNKLPELKNYLRNSKHQPDLICLQETHLQNSQYIKLIGYDILFNNRKNSQGGGVLIAIKQQIQYTPQETTEEDIIAATIKLKNKNLDIINAYLPPNKNINN
jgi:exonuclease III